MESLFAVDATCSVTRHLSKVLTQDLVTPPVQMDPVVSPTHDLGPPVRVAIPWQKSVLLGEQVLLPVKREEAELPVFQRRNAHCHFRVHFSRLSIEADPVLPMNSWQDTSNQNPGIRMPGPQSLSAGDYLPRKMGAAPGLWSTQPLRSTTLLPPTISMMTPHHREQHEEERPSLFHP